MKRVLLASAALAASPAHALRFQCVDLGYIYNSYSVAGAVNDARMVVGSTGGNRAPIFWTQETGMRRMGPAMRSFHKGYATGVNESGTVVGWVDWADAAMDYQQPFVWRKETGFRRLDTLNGFHGSATGVNEAGEACGYNVFEALYWDAQGRAEVIPPLNPRWQSLATGINDSGEVCGIGGTGEGPLAKAHGFRWSAAEGTSDLGLLPFCDQAFAYGINNSGTVIGWCFGSLGMQGFAADPGQQMRPIATVATEPYAINSAGAIVGIFSPGGGNKVKAMLIEPGGVPVDLNLVSDGIPSGWNLDQARGINDRGDICGIAAVGTKVRAFLLIRTD